MGQEEDETHHQTTRELPPSEHDEEENTLLPKQPSQSTATYYNSTTILAPDEGLQVTHLLSAPLVSTKSSVLTAHQLTKTLLRNNNSLATTSDAAQNSNGHDRTKAATNNGTKEHDATPPDDDEQDDAPPDTVERVLFANISFQLALGTLTVVHGPSGCGKSTILKILARLVPPDQGRISGDLGINDPSPELWRRHVRYCTQSKITIPGTPLDLVNQVTQFRSWNHPKSSAERLSQLLKQYCTQFGLDASQCLAQDWNRLSGGEAQRVYLALCLATQPQVLLMDESTSALDHDAKLQVEQVIRQELTRGNMAIVWITHDQEQVARLARAL